MKDAVLKGCVAEGHHRIELRQEKSVLWNISVK